MTFDPCTALQTAIRQRLIGLPSITDLVPANHIRAGSTRPDKMPTIIISPTTIQMHGRASGSQFVATVLVDIHIWTNDVEYSPPISWSSVDLAKQIGSALAHALIDWPETDGFELDAFKHQRTVWPRDPDKNYGHGVAFVEAVVRWSI